MKTIFVHTKSKLDVMPAVRKVQTGKVLGIVTTVQHLDSLKQVQKLFPKSIIGGQVLGCDVSAAEKIVKKVDAFLFIGSGEFHPLQIAYATGKDVYCANPYVSDVRVITSKDVEQWRLRTKGAFLKFLNSKRVGILVSAKSGQNNFKDAEQFKDSTDKEAFLFLADTLDFNELENFPDIECWINTACPRIGYDDTKRTSKSIINLSDLKRLS